MAFQFLRPICAVLRMPQRVVLTMVRALFKHHRPGLASSLCRSYFLERDSLPWSKVGFGVISRSALVAARRTNLFVSLQAIWSIGIALEAFDLKSASAEIAASRT